MQPALPAVRIDKWLWAVRVFKTRSLATEACRAGHVEIGGQRVKASREIRVGEVIFAKVGPLTRTLKVLGLIERRVGAPAAREHAEDLTPAAEWEKLRERRVVAGPEANPGRPTKKQRRALDRAWSKASAWPMAGEWQD